MKNKTKRTWLIVLGALVCIALIVGIATRFGGRTVTDPELDNGTQSQNTPVVDIDTPEQNTPVVNIDTSGNAGSQDAKPGAGADSSGTEQTIQSDPVRPEAPENPTPVEDDHDSADVPEADRNAETPPTYTQEQTTVTTPSEPQGEGYLPGFGYIESSGEGTVIHDDTIYENGNKIGVMD
jgi:FtsZ-interacting cell division protein ZipA